MAAKTIRNLVPGEQVKLHFHGSKQFGNEAYDMDATFVEFKEDGTRAVFAMDGNKDSTFEAYKFSNRWAYGSSAERLTIAS